RNTVEKGLFILLTIFFKIGHFICFSMIPPTLRYSFLFKEMLLSHRLNLSSCLYSLLLISRIYRISQSRTNMIPMPVYPLSFPFLKASVNNELYHTGVFGCVFYRVRYPIL